MKFIVNTAVAAAIAFAAAPAFAGSQLAASAGLSQAEAQGLSLSEIAQLKFNRDTRGDDRHPIVIPGSGGDYDRLVSAAGLSADEAAGMTLDEVFVSKINREARGDEQQAAPGDGVTMSSRSASGAANGQLAASAGIPADEAAGMTLGQIAAAKFARDTDDNH